jgi:hypothetical protein
MDETTRYLDLELEDLIVKVNEAIETTDKLGIADRKTESPSGKSGTQQAVNREFVNALKANAQTAYTFSNSNAWSISHLLNKRPCVKTVDAKGAEIVGTIEYTTANNCVVHFSEPQSGTAYVN